MPTVLSSSLRHKNLNNFKTTVEDESVYFFVSKPSTWLDSNGDVNDLVPAQAYDTFILESDAYNEMMYLKKLSISNCINVIRLHRWQANRRYQQYDNSTDLSDLLTKRTISTDEYYPFYVITDEYKVYKCISNGSTADDPNGVPSEVKPTTTAYDPNNTELYYSLSDGYIWKYMYTLKPQDASEFLTTDWFPIRTIQENDTSDNWDIITNAQDGAVYNIKITNGGTSYDRILPASDLTDGINTHGFTYTVNGTNVTITSGSPNTTTDYYKDCYFYTKNTNGIVVDVRTIIGQSGNIISLSGTVGTGQRGFISPKVVITGDGNDLLAVARMDSNAINRIQIVEPGTGYTECSVSFLGGAGEGATATAIISPAGGHGSDPAVELGGFNLMTKVKFEGDEGGTIISSNEYRKIGMIVNPLSQGTMLQAQAREGGMTTSQIKLNGSQDGSIVTSGRKILIYSGKGKGQLRTIDNYDDDPIATVTEPFDILPDGTSYYGFVASDTVLNQCLVLSYNTIAGTISPDTVIYQGTLGSETAIGNVVQHDTDNKKIYVTNLGKSSDAVSSYPYFGGTTSTNITGGGSFTPTGATGPLVAKNTGSVIYMENRTPLSRYAEQIEDIRVIIQF